MPTALLHNLKHNKVLHERVVLMKVETEDIPHVPDDQRIEVKHLEHNFHTVMRQLRLHGRAQYSARPGAAAG